MAGCGDVGVGKRVHVTALVQNAALPQQLYCALLGMYTRLGAEEELVALGRPSGSGLLCVAQPQVLCSLSQLVCLMLADL